jgi:hypothetical protein
MKMSAVKIVDLLLGGRANCLPYKSGGEFYDRHNYKFLLGCLARKKMTRKGSNHKQPGIFGNDLRL